MMSYDFKKILKPLYKPSPNEVSVVKPPKLRYLMIDGQGNPESAERYHAAVTALYALAYSVRSLCKAEGNVFVVMPLEGLWRFEGDPSRILLSQLKTRIASSGR